MINKLLNKFKKIATGFTLIETLGAVLLLSVALVGPMTIAQKGLQTSLISKDQNTAFNLAQDAVELIRYARDTNCLKQGSSSCPTGGWLTFASGVDLTPCVSTDGSAACYFDSLGNSPGVPTTCGSVGTACPVINYDSTNNYFTYAATGGSVTSSIFTRTVKIKYDNSGCSGSCNTAEADIVVTVSWNDPVAHSIQVNESLYDWQ